MYVDLFVHLIAVKHIIPQIPITVMHPSVSFFILLVNCDCNYCNTLFSSLHYNKNTDTVYRYCHTVIYIYIYYISIHYHLNKYKLKAVQQINNNKLH